MSFQDILKNATQQVKTEVTGASNRAKNAANNTVHNVEVNATNTVVSAGVRGVTGAAAALMQGDPAGALTKLTNVPNDVLSQVGFDGGSLLQGGFNAISNLAGPAGGNGLAGALARSDPLMAYNWYVELPLLSPPDRPPTSLQWYYVEECTLPSRAYEPRSIFQEGRHRHYVKSYSLDGLRLGFYLDEGGTSLSYLKAWEDCIVYPATAQNYRTNGGGFGRPSDYRKPIRVILLNASKRLVVMFELVECWPTNLDALSLMSGQSERLIGQVSFSVGDVFPTFYAINDNFFSSLVGQAASTVFSSISSAITKLPQSTAVGKNFVQNTVSMVGGGISRFL